MFKKSISVLLSVIMIFGVFTIIPFPAFAATSGTTGDCTWTLSDNGVLTISGNGAMEDDSSPWGIFNCSEVIINDGVTYIGRNAFSGCTGLTSIEIPDSVTSIGDSAFSQCTSLTSVEIPDSVRSVGLGAFSGTAWLNNQPDGLVYAGKVAYTMKGTCPSHVEIKDGTVEIAGYAFDDCKELTRIEIPNSVVSIGGSAFLGCKGLTSIEIPDSVTSIESYTFYGTGLTSIDIPDSATSIGEYAFFACTGLKSVTIGNSVTSIADSAFEGCVGLESIEIPDSVTSIGEYAFCYCHRLINVTIGNFVTSIGYGAFYDCKNLTIYGYEDTVAETYAKANAITFIPIPPRQCDNCQEFLNRSSFKRGYPATCTTDGLTDGYTCPSCGHQVEQAIIPATGHKPVIDQAVAATCKSEGRTVGSHCETCGEVFIQSEVIPKLAHTPVTDKAVAADCTHTGLTEGSHCSVCNEVIVAQNVIPKTAHTVVIDEAVAADCTHTGLTKGSHCSVCSEVIVAQNVIPITHKPGASVIENSVNPSCTSAGSYETVTYCTECGNEISRVRTTVKALGHDYIYLPDITATYFHAGQTEGIKCSRCGDWLIESHDIPMLVGEGVFCDVDGDEDVSSLDITFIMRWLADYALPFELDELWADVDDDGELSVLDVTLIQRWLAGFPSSEHIGALLG